MAGDVGGGIHPVSLLLGRLQAGLEEGHRQRQELRQAQFEQSAELRAQSELLTEIRTAVDLVNKNVATVSSTMLELTGKDGRIAKLETTAEDYRTNKRRVGAFLAGAGLSGTGLGAALTKFWDKLIS